ARRRVRTGRSAHSLEVRFDRPPSAIIRFDARAPDGPRGDAHQWPPAGQSVIESGQLTIPLEVATPVVEQLGRSFEVETGADPVAIVVPRRPRAALEAPFPEDAPRLLVYILERRRRGMLIGARLEAEIV